MTDRHMTERQWRNLEAGLREYADDTACREPSPEVLKVLEASLAGRRAPGIAPVWRWAAAAAVLVCLGVMLGRWSRVPPIGESSTGTRIRVPIATEDDQPVSPDWSPAVRLARQPPASRPRTYTPWFVDRSLPQAPFGQVTRVRIDAASAARFGIVAASRDEMIEADIFVGHDGLARAIRFVR